ncbi:hypothetical protein [Paenibacillus sedimenti]|uniref:Lipoprotein n=1 Tax=Paenibacillus sedimenti TaxID=2770274 RepID=A0A926KRX7_9BACL|nr:hypothetical protein [Paenibacillus sedimenti]MBD0382417.1 hypothetical protein [Paenibacillus sedimenti]
MSRTIHVLMAAALLSALTGCAGNEKGQGTAPTASPTPLSTASPTPSSTASPAPSTTATAKPAPATAVPSPSAKPGPVSVASEAAAKKAIESRTQETVQALKKRDMKKLAELVHPEKGVQFSAYSHIDEKKDVRIKGSELAPLWKEADKRIWGIYDGSGEPIELTFQAYFGKFVYNQDYSAAPQIGYNKTIGKGNTVNNVFDVYPKEKYVTVEYHFPGFDAKHEGMDWSSLRLVYGQHNQQWYLVAVIHDQHTI